MNRPMKRAREKRVRSGQCETTRWPLVLRLRRDSLDVAQLLKGLVGVNGHAAELLRAAKGFFGRLQLRMRIVERFVGQVQFLVSALIHTQAKIMSPKLTATRPGKRMILRITLLTWRARISPRGPESKLGPVPAQFRSRTD